MSQHTNQKGFTLVELLISTLIVAGLSVVSVNMLYTTLSSRAKQTSVETSTDSVRVLYTTLSSAVEAAKSITVVNSTTIQITGTPCRTIKYDNPTKALVQAIDTSALCTAPEVIGPSYTGLTSNQIQILTFSLSPTGNAPSSVTISLTGTYKDSVTDHPFTYYTTVTPRITL